MNEINKLLRELTDNKPLLKKVVKKNIVQQQVIAHKVKETIQSYRKPAPKRNNKKVLNSFEYESTLLKTLEALSNIANTQNQLQIQYQEIWNQLYESKRELGLMVADEQYANDEKIQIKYELLDEALEGIRTHIPEKQQRKPKEVQVELTQNQIVILFHNMQSLGMVGKNIPNTLLAKNISAITGLSKEKIRQALSNIKSDSDSVESISFTEMDYHKVKNKIQCLTAKIQQDLDSKF